MGAKQWGWPTLTWPRSPPIALRATDEHPAAGCSSVARGAVVGDLGEVGVGQHPRFAPLARVSLQVHQTR